MLGVQAGNPAACARWSISLVPRISLKWTPQGYRDRDPLVPVNQSELFYEALKSAGVDVMFHKIVGAGHGGPAFNTPVVRAMVLAFFDQHLKAN